MYISPSGISKADWAKYETMDGWITVGLQLPLGNMAFGVMDVGNVLEKSTHFIRRIWCGTTTIHFSLTTTIKCLCSGHPQVRVVYFGCRSEDDHRMLMGRLGQSQRSGAGRAAGWTRLISTASVRYSRSVRGISAPSGSWIIHFPSKCNISWRCSRRTSTRDTAWSYRYARCGSLSFLSLSSAVHAERRAQ